MNTRILYVITKANWGGAQRYVYDLALAAKREGHEVSVAHGEGEHLVGRLSEAGIRTLVIKSLTRDVRLGKDIAVFFELIRLFRRERPEVVHLNSAKASGLGALAARIAFVPRIIFTAHGWAFNESRPWWQKVSIRLLSWITILLSHTTICVSQSMHRDMSWMPCTRRKIVVIHHGIECAPLKERHTARAALLPRHEQKFWIGMNSELHPTKRIIDAVFAMSMLVKKHPETILVVISEGEERARLEKTIHSLDLADHVFLVGFIPDAPTYMHAFDIFLHASRSEALGYVILEAGCAGLPVVATRVGGIPEIITDGTNGLLVPPERPANLAIALTSLVGNPDKSAQFGEALHRTIRNHFSKEAMVADTLALYR